MSTLDEEMQADALEAQKFSRKHLVLELDFSEASIGELDGQVDQVEYAIKGGNSAENVAMLKRIWGAYLGEALRKKGGGHWVRDDEGKIGLKTDKTTLFPHEQVALRMAEGSQHDLTEYFRKSLQ